jgi:cyclopropane fatty-acyl-phospholipid synthase-like methyltransferase
MNHHNINDTFFSGAYKDVWRKLIPAGLTEAETDFIEEAAHLKKGEHVLDIMCGYGRHTLVLANRGYNVTAVDNLQQYIDEINNTAGDQQLSVQGICAGLLDVELAGMYDAAICMGNSFAFFDETDALTVLQNLSAHLKQNGVFIINTWMLGEIAIKHYHEKDWFYAGDYKYLVDNQYLFNPTRIESDHIIIRKDGVTETIKGIDYIFTVAELDALLGSLFPRSTSQAP